MMKPTFIIIVWISVAESSSLLQPIRLKEKGGSLKYLHSKAMANESPPHLIIKLLIGEASRQEPPAASTTNQSVRKRSRRATGKMTEQSKLTFDLGTSGCANFACAADKAAKKPPVRLKTPPLKTIKNNTDASTVSSIAGLLSKSFKGFSKAVNVLKKLKRKLNFKLF